MIKNEIIRINDLSLPVYSINTLIIGSGAASLNCADHLFSFGVKDILIVTDYLGGGASNLSGSDKQTFYKMSLFGDGLDSTSEMSKTLFAGGCMHGDIALIESTVSSQEFFHLCSIGVQFPHNKYGGYTGYKTDHDPRQRATSAGPKTSNQMVQRLIEQINLKGIPILDQIEIISLLYFDENSERKVVGAIGINKREIENQNFGLTILNCENIVFGVGGPGGIYYTSVYPEGQNGAIGLALEIGSTAQNLTESQYGLASTKFRWNVSGTYQQVIPRYISTDKDGNDEKEFLNPYFPSMKKLATDIFLKGYQWPFDSRKVQNYGSSLIDCLVYQEQVLNGRRVFLDFRKNPSGAGILADFSFEDLEEEAYIYLKNSNALFGTPIERLKKMNPLSIDLYKEHGIDIENEPLEIAVCAQHNNGGLTGNIWWQSDIKNLFPIGEVNGSHGVYRPGGAALNSGQVGGFRAAEYISEKCNNIIPNVNGFYEKVNLQIKNKIEKCKNISEKIDPDTEFCKTMLDEIQNRMTNFGSHIREKENISNAIEDALKQKEKLINEISIKNRLEIISAIRTESLWLTHLTYLMSIKEYLDFGGGSRGSYLVMDKEGKLISDKLNDNWKFKPEDPELREKILTIKYIDGKFEMKWIPVRAIPEDNFWFENVWHDFREKKYFD